MSKRLFVGGLSRSITSSQLKDILSKVCPVSSVDVIMDRDSGESKGFAFVEIEDEKQADEVIKTFNGTEIEGRKIAVNIARPREERPRFNTGGFNTGRNFRRNDRRGDRNSRRRSY